MNGDWARRVGQRISTPHNDDNRINFIKPPTRNQRSFIRCRLTAVSATQNVPAPFFRIQSAMSSVESVSNRSKTPECSRTDWRTSYSKRVAMKWATQSDLSAWQLACHIRLRYVIDSDKFASALLQRSNPSCCGLIEATLPITGDLLPCLKKLITIMLQRSMP